MQAFCLATCLTKKLSQWSVEGLDCRCRCSDTANAASCGFQFWHGGFRMFRLMVADVDSPSYFVATAAAELGFFKEEGIDIEFELAYGAKSGPERLRDGTLHFFGGPAYAATRAFPAWKGARLLCALAQYSYWFL